MTSPFQPLLEAAQSLHLQAHLFLLPTPGSTPEKGHPHARLEVWGLSVEAPWARSVVRALPKGCNEDAFTKRSLLRFPRQPPRLPRNGN